MDRSRPVSADERRARLARRHRLSPDHRAAGVEDAADAVVALHGTDAVGLHLSVRARTRGTVPDDLDAALHHRRTLVRQMAMRRTIWVVPRHRLGAVLRGVSARVAEAERRRLVAEVERQGVRSDGAAWLRAATEAVAGHLADGREATTIELRDALPVLVGSLTTGVGRTWEARQGLTARVLTVMWADGQVVRATNGGDWWTSRPRWARTEAWLGGPVEQPPEDDARRELVRAWLQAFGPGTEDDLVWWFGTTRRAVRQALASLATATVDLDGRVGYLLADDDEPPPTAEPWAALLGPLDPTTMGWRERSWYLGPHGPRLFDSVGNGGPTVWWDGRIVGGWWQDDAGDVVVALLEDVGADARAAIETEAAAVTAWFGGRRVLPRRPSPLAAERAGRAGPG